MDRGGRVLGMIVFLLGIAFLIVVFAIAHRMFAAPISSLVCEAAGGKPSVGASDLASAAVATIVRIGLLFVMTLAGSLIAARGMHLYLGSAQPHGEEQSKPSDDD